MVVSPPGIEPLPDGARLFDRSLFSLGLTIFVVSLGAMVGLSFCLARGFESASSARIVGFLLIQFFAGLGMGLISRSRRCTPAWGAFSPVLAFLFVLLCDGRVLEPISTMFIVPFHFIPLIFTMPTYAEGSADEEVRLFRLVLLWVFLLTLPIVTAPVALAYGVRAIESYHRRKQDLSWAFGLTLVAALGAFLSAGAIRSFSHREALAPAVDVVQGKVSLVRLPPNWADLSVANSAPEYDVMVGSKTFRAVVAVNPFPKQDGYQLDEIAKAAVERDRQNLGSAFVLTGPVIRTVGERKRLEFVFQNPKDDSREAVRVLTFWETPQGCWLTRAWTDHEGYREHIDELRFVADNVYSTR